MARSWGGGYFSNGNLGATARISNSPNLNPAAAITVAAWAYADHWTGANRRILQPGTTIRPAAPLHALFLGRFLSRNDFRRTGRYMHHR